MGRNAQRRRKAKAINKLKDWTAKRPDGPRNKDEQRTLERLLIDTGQTLGKVLPAESGPKEVPKPVV